MYKKWHDNSIPAIQFEKLYCVEFKWSRISEKIRSIIYGILRIKQITEFIYQYR
jgi:hypothetical protein